MSAPSLLPSEAAPVRRARARAHLHPRRTGLRVAWALALVGPALHAQTAGSLDPAFAADVTGSYVSATLGQPDGKIVLAGNFSAVNGQTRNSIARLRADGAAEDTATFNPGTGANFWTQATAVQSDGKLLIGGPFTTVNGQTRNHIARLLANGTVESTATFNPGTGLTSTILNYAATSVGLQTDGKILITGQFTSVNGQARRGIARLLTNGTVESTATFNPGSGTHGISSMALQADGKILLGLQNGIIRLHADGAAESAATFNSNATAGVFVFSVALQADGKILLGGAFTSIDGQLRNRLARLTNDVATQSLTIPDATRVLWLRGGAAPEVEQVTFELSTNGGTNWSLLGSGTRIIAGWELTGLSLPASGSIRSRGRTVGSGRGSSPGLVESVAVFPVPALSIAQADAQVVVSWPFPSAGFLLQQNTSLDSTGWTLPSETVTDSATTRSITVTPAPGSRFFQLFRP